ncbi:MAG: DUF5989 family protein [Planctomycetota bacterium]
MRRFLSATRTRFRTAVELIVTLWDGPYWWLVPVVLLLLPAALVFIFLQAAPLVAPFVYTVF